MTSQHDLAATTTLNAATTELTVCIVDARPEPVAPFGPLSEHERKALATDAWRVGLRAVMGAYQQADESRLSDVSRDLRESLDVQCRSFVERQEQTLKQVLTRYFDPRDGQVIERLQDFLRNDGVLAQTMDKYLAPERGMLALSLARQVGESSPLLKALSPTESKGFLVVLEQRIGEALESQQAELTRALERIVPMNEGRRLEGLRLLRDRRPRRRWADRQPARGAARLECTAPGRERLDLRVQPGERNFDCHA